MFKEADETLPKYRLIAEIEDKFKDIHIEELVRYIVTHENEFLKDETFKIWIENKAHLSMAKLYQRELRKLKKQGNDADFGFKESGNK